VQKLTEQQDLSSTPADNSPLARFFAREASTGEKLLARIRRDLSDLVEVCNGNLKQTNELRALMSDLNKGDLLQTALGEMVIANSG
jgi:dynein heavy chain 1